MKQKLNLVIGIYFLTELMYKIFTCPSCQDSILWIEVSGFVKILYYITLVALCFYAVYLDNWAKKEVE